MTNTQSAFGEQMDSLCDMVSFGLAPALIVYEWALKGLGKPGWIVAFIYCAAAALRLARFNTNIGVVDKRFFQGLPSPAAAARLSSRRSAAPPLRGERWVSTCVCSSIPARCSWARNSSRMRIDDHDCSADGSDEIIATTSVPAIPGRWLGRGRGWARLAGALGERTREGLERSGRPREADLERGVSSRAGNGRQRLPRRTASRPSRWRSWRACRRVERLTCSRVAS
jgi:hypothetical protein